MFGDTDSGKAWCIKALHPSDPITGVYGIPDRSSAPSLVMNYQTTATITPAVGATGTWEVEMAVLPHPIGFLWTHVTDSIGNRVGTVLNSQLPGVDHAEKVAAFRRIAQQWRVTHVSVSVHQDGPTVYDQGTLVACQAPVSMHRMYWGSMTSIAMVNRRVIHSPVGVFESSDVPEFQNLQSMPNAYFGNSKYGCYLPLKLTRSCQRWVTGADDFTLGAVGTVTSSSNILDIGSLPLVATSTVGGYPFPDLEVAGWEASPSLPYLDGVLYGKTTTDFCNDAWGFIAARNMSVATSLTVFCRVGLEMRVLPGTTLTPQQKLPPPGDLRALETYFTISREMADAYPVDYNDLGKIWDVISSVAKTVAPALAAIPGVGIPLSAAVGGAASLGDTIKAAITRSNNAVSAPESASMADRDLARRVVETATPVVVQPRAIPLRKKKKKVRVRTVKLKKVK